MPGRIRWLSDVIPVEALGEQASVAKAIEVVERPSAEMCLQCRGGRMLCGKPRCPVLLNAQVLARRGLELDSELIEGSSPGGVFVGRFGYPKVRIGPMVPPIYGDTSVLDTPERWVGKSIDEIVDYRFSLIRGNVRASVFDAQKSGRLLEQLQELSMASRPVEAELQLTRRPRKVLFLSDDAQPFGPSAPLKALTSTNIPLDHRLEKAHYDRDLKAGAAAMELYRAGVLVSRIQRAFSTGSLGTSAKRRLVPTRWSITAVDSIVSLALIDEIRHCETIDEYRVYSFSHLDNFYVAILMPEPWKFEWVEAWFPQTHWNVYGAEPAVMGDYEEHWGRTAYASIGGCYYSVRLAVAEGLKSEGRQAACLVVREIHPGYLLPLGVWNVRESIRAMLKGRPACFSTLQGALDHASTKLTIPLRRWVEASVLLQRALYQRKITDYVGDGRKGGG